MKKIRNQSAEIHQKSGQEIAKKLYRSTTEQAKRLDDARSCARTICELFSPNLQIQRKKFGDYCERLIFIEPSVYGRKCDEILWRKAYYDVITSAKKLKGKSYTSHEVTNILAHINSGIGFYHHYIAKLQTEHDLNLQNLTDFTTAIGSDKTAPDWVDGAIYQCLIYLGDLNRYKIEIYPKLLPTLAFRYYLQAINMKPDHGMPHNQMGTLAMQQERFLDAVYHYLCCLSCTVSFDGTVNNLRNLFDKNTQSMLQETRVEKRFISRFLFLIDVWYTNKKHGKMYELCHQTYKDLEECLAPKNCASPVEESDLETVQNPLSGDDIFKVIAVLIMCISRMQQCSSVQISTAVAFALALYSQLIQNLTNHIQESVLNYPLPDVDYKPDTNGVVKDLLKKRSSNAKLRRRKAVKVESESESSDCELSESSYDSFESDIEVVESSDEETKDDDKEDDLIRRIKRMDVNHMLEIITEQSSLQAIKIINDWLMFDTDTIKSCASNTKSLLRQIANMLNLININVKSGKLTGVKLNITDVIKNEDRIPLAEDVMLKNIDLLSRSHRNIDWKYLTKRGLNVKEESVIRIVKFLNFGKYLCGITETEIVFNEKRNVFVWNGSEDEEKAQIVEEVDQSDGISIMKNHEDTGLSKMKHMGQLWLASEVKALEKQVRGKTSLSPYLVLDCDALIKYTFMVKHLVHSRKFIVLIPSAALDDLKREQSEARDAIRWLESQFHRGNRFFRSQRQHERAPIPFIKYPKKKDKEMSIYIQIIECCHYLSEQQKGASNVVTLLIGNQNVLSNGENKEFSYVGLAQSAGVTVESITQFYSKWKKSYKMKR